MAEGSVEITAFISPYGIRRRRERAETADILDQRKQFLLAHAALKGGHIVGVAASDVFCRKQDGVTEIGVISNHHLAVLERHGLAIDSLQWRRLQAA